jgi:predicted dehydrogenase
MVSPFVPFAEPLAVQDQQFIDCIANSSTPVVDGSSGLAVVQTLECAQISLREQRPVALAEVTRQRTGWSAGLDEAFARTSVD